MNLKNLSEACAILAKYTDDPWTVHPGHNQITFGVDPENVSKEDIAKLDALGVSPESGGDDWFYCFT